ncbi:MAG TPA: DNA polymerase III subunit delta' C-terminal domain-containing protein [Candidatus Xenobia bacterium]|nr:DNA polymerase III subunit delta' C-terminal domain-containing protein [Candidatus Xenobia bacterium]
MTFKEFLGNARAVDSLRRLLAAERLPQALLLAGPRGVGKFTLATLLARAANCAQAPGEICGRCQSCRAMAALDDLPALVEAARRERGSASPEDVPLILRPHACATVLVPDADYIRVSQMRYVVREAYALPTAGRRNFFIFDQAERLRHDFADALLKVLEEPPAQTTLILVTDAPFELRATIRSRCVPVWFAPLERDEIASYLAEHRPELKKADRDLAASAAAGSLGTALTLDIARYRELRARALEVLRSALTSEASPQHLFEATAALAGKAARREESDPESEGRKNFEFSLDILYGLLTDSVYLKVDVPDAGLRHPDLRAELRPLSQKVTWSGLSQAVERLDRIWKRQRRNINRQLALDAWAVAATVPVSDR